LGDAAEFEKRFHAKSWINTFHAAKAKKAQEKCVSLDEKMLKLSQERAGLEREIQDIESKQSGDNDAREQLKVLKDTLQSVQEKERSAKKDLEQEVMRWQDKADESMREATRSKVQMERMMACMKGVEAFQGTGKGEFAESGAQPGFCSVQQSMGFSMDTITFGTIDSGQLLMYETSMSKKIGDGRDCAYKCRCLSSDIEYCCKMYQIKDQEQRRSIHNDLFAQQEQVGKHPRIVSYERVIESENTIFVLMELLPGMDLFDYVLEEGLTEDQAKGLFRELVEALSHLHENKVIHCDIKPENAMVIGDANEGNAHLKLIDFGLSCFQKHDQMIDGDASSGVGGGIVLDQYTPPEHLASLDVPPTMGTDMWRLGCTLYFMLVGEKPFKHTEYTEAGKKERQEERFIKEADFEELSDEAKDLIGRLIVASPEARLNTQQVLEHPWILEPS
jgi:hypothetical protein